MCVRASNGGICVHIGHTDTAKTLHSTVFKELHIQLKTNHWNPLAHTTWSIWWHHVWKNQWDKLNTGLTKPTAAKSSCEYDKMYASARRFPPVFAIVCFQSRVCVCVCVRGKSNDVLVCVYIKSGTMCWWMCVSIFLSTSLLLTFTLARQTKSLSQNVEVHTCIRRRRQEHCRRERTTCKHQHTHAHTHTKHIHTYLLKIRVRERVRANIPIHKTGKFCVNLREV